MKPIRLISRAALVLKSFTPEELELSAADVSRKVQIPTTTAHRMLAALTKSGLLERNAETRKYTIGPEMFVLGNLYLQKMDLFQAAQPVVKILNELTRESINVAILDKGNCIWVMREDSHHGLIDNIHVGSIFPAYCPALGRALLSELTETGIDSLYPEEKLPPITKKTISTKTELKLRLKQVRESGISFDSESTIEGVVAFAALIRRADGIAIAALGIALPKNRMNPKKHELFTSLIKMSASLTSYRLGYKDMVNPVSGIEEIRSWWTQNTLNMPI